MIKKILYVLGGLIGLLVVATIVMTFMAPKDFSVERSITINKPKAEVFAYLKLLKNQDNWSTWSKKDPGMKKEFKGTDGTVGFTSIWDSNHSEVGAGEQEIKTITEAERIDVEIRFKKPFESTSMGYFITEAAGDNQTKVKWGFAGSFPRPMNIMLLFMDIDKEAGKEFDEGLTSLKSLLEKPAG